MNRGPYLRLAVGISIAMGAMGCASFLRLRAPSPCEAAAAIERVFASAHSADAFHGTVLVGEGERLIYEGSFGLADRAQNRPVDENTAFPIASVTKPIVAITILRMQEEGLLDLDDPAVRHLPGFPYATITIRHLLQHTSGLKMNLGKVLAGLTESRIADNRRVLEVLYSAQPPLVSTPGERFEYSNVGYIVLAELIAAVAHSPYREVVRKHVFEPSGMANTDFMGVYTPKNRLAKTYVKQDDGRWIIDATSDDFAYVRWLANIQGNGDVVSTARDLWRLDQALNRGLLPAAALADMHRPARRRNGTIVWQGNDRTESYGLGWSISKRRKIYGHTGDWGGALAWYKRYPKFARVAVVLQNHRSTDVGWVPKLDRILTRPIASDGDACDCI